MTKPQDTHYTYLSTVPSTHAQSVIAFIDHEQRQIGFIYNFLGSWYAATDPNRLVDTTLNVSTGCQYRQDAADLLRDNFYKIDALTKKYQHYFK